MGVTTRQAKDLNSPPRTPSSPSRTLPRRRSLIVSYHKPASSPIHRIQKTPSPPRKIKTEVECTRKNKSKIIAEISYLPASAYAWPTAYIQDLKMRVASITQHLSKNLDNYRDTKHDDEMAEMKVFVRALGKDCVGMSEELKRSCIVLEWMEGQMMELRKRVDEIQGVKRVTEDVEVGLERIPEFEGSEVDKGQEVGSEERGSEFGGETEVDVEEQMEGIDYEEKQQKSGRMEEQQTVVPVPESAQVESSGDETSSEEWTGPLPLGWGRGVM